MTTATLAMGKENGFHRLNANNRSVASWGTALAESRSLGERTVIS